MAQKKQQPLSKPQAQSLPKPQEPEPTRTLEPVLVDFVLATTQPDQQGYRFSEAALYEMQKDLKQKPIHVNFDPSSQVMGFVNSAEVKGKRLVCEATMRDFVADQVFGLFVVPGITSYRYHAEDDIRVIEHCKLASLAVVKDPADPNLQPISRVKEPVKRH